MTVSCTTNGAVLEAPPVEGAISKATEMKERLAARVGAFAVPEFVPHRWLRGGHLQTLLSTRREKPIAAGESVYQRHRVALPEGEAMIMHDDRPGGWTPAAGSVLLLHGICGCHSASYMLRFHHRLNAMGIRTFRLDMRGCGDSAEFCRTITHAGRSEDVLAAMQCVGEVVDDRSSPIGAVGVSLGGNQLLLTAGRIGNGTHARPEVWDRVGPILAIAPPLDLQRCSDALQAFRLRFYNWYFIKHLFHRASPLLRSREDYQAMLRLPRPKTLRQFDRAITAPLAGFESEREYYGESSAISVIHDIAVPTMVVTSADDPLVPVDSFEGLGSDSVRVHITPSGGHHGFLQRDRTSWSDDLVSEFFAGAWPWAVKNRDVG